MGNGINQSSEFSDVLEDVLVQGTVTVGTTQTALNVSGTNNPEREVLRIYNSSNSTIYIGPSGVTADASSSEPLFKNQWIEFPIGDSLTMYAIVASGTADVVVWEIG